MCLHACRPTYLWRPCVLVIAADLDRREPRCVAACDGLHAAPQRFAQAAAARVEEEQPVSIERLRLVPLA
jgi:hypothetical protein